MTTATAKARGRSRGTAPRLTPLALALGAVLVAGECQAAWKVTPNVSVRETYTDNATQQSGEQSQSQLITDLSPGFTVAENSRRLKLGANAQFHLFGYTNNDPNSKRGLADSSYQYDAQAQLEAVDELLYVDANASRIRASTSAFGQLGDSSGSSLYSNVNRSDITVWSISPYLHHRFGSFADATVRLTRDSVQGGTAGFGDSMASTRSAFVMRPGDNTFGWKLSYMHQDLAIRNAGITATTVGGDSSSENEVAGISYRLQRTLSLTADVGYDKYEYAANQRTAGRRWSAGFIWAPSLRTNVQASFGHRYFGATGMLAATHRSRHTVWSLDYNDDVTTSRSQFLLPAAIDTAALLDRLFSSQVPDPVQRQQAVQAYMASAGLPASLAQSINYLSNRYVRDKRLQGAVVWRMPHSDATFSVYRDQRTALSLQQSDSALLGSQQSALNDNVRQRGASLQLSHRLSGRTEVLAGIDAIHVRSLVTDIENYSRAIHAGLNHHFSRYAVGSVDVRQMRGGAGINLPNFKENAVVAVYSVRY
jgi:uncharacterized protein (PEP-CTERM system associated)